MGLSGMGPPPRSSRTRSGSPIESALGWIYLSREALARAKAQDEEVASHRGTTYAGEADPYKKPREIDEDDEDEASAL